MTEKIIVVFGPTASGKSAYAMGLAQKKEAVIINADSQQIYKDLPILTARPTAEDEKQAPHKLYGVLNAHEPSSAGHWLKLAKMEIDWARDQGRVPIVVGGTGLYIKALMQGMNAMPDISPEVRMQAVSDYEQMGKEAFEERLRWADPEFFERLKVYDKQRLTRAYEVWLGSGKPITWWQDQEAVPAYKADEIELIKVDKDREELYARCDLRFEQMLEQGALDEVKEFIGRSDIKGQPERGGIYKTIGLKELSAYINGDISLEEAKAAAQQLTRRYAKRQMTWMRNQL